MVDWCEAGGWLLVWLVGCVFGWLVGGCLIVGGWLHVWYRLVWLVHLVGCFFWFGFVVLFFDKLFIWLIGVKLVVGY